MGDMLGFPKGAIVNLVVRQREEDGAGVFAARQRCNSRPRWRPARASRSATRTISADDVAFLQYTGGTTGVSKGATLLHRNIVANVLQNDAWLQPALAKEPKVDQLFIVTALPLYHIFALTACFLLAMRAGGVCLLIPNPRDIPNLVKELQKYKPNNVPGGEHALQRAAQSSGFRQDRFLGAQGVERRRHGGAARGRRALAQGDRLPDHRRLRPLRDLADAHLQSRPTARSSAARSACRCPRPRSRSATMPATNCRSDSRAKSARAARR